MEYAIAFGFCLLLVPGAASGMTFDTPVLVGMVRMEPLGTAGSKLARLAR